jgi:hypothetical protein
MSKPCRQPTDAEYAAYDGMHCRTLWRETPESWRCPACGRSKRQILIWGKRVGSNAANYGPIGFKAGLHKHHVMTTSHPSLGADRSITSSSDWSQRAA